MTMRILLCLLAITSSLQAQVTNLTFLWDYPASSGTVFRLYEQSNAVWRVITTGSTNGAIYFGYDVTKPHTMSVTASNMLGESDKSLPLVVPPAPTAPVNLRPVPLSMTVPFESVIQFSKDLVNWDDRLRIQLAQQGLLLTFRTQPTEPLMFMRQAPPGTVPLSPTTLGR